MKKFAALAMAAAVLAGTLAGCGGSASDLEKIEKNGVLKVGITLYEPMNYKDEDGNLTGFDTELTQAVCEKLGVDAEFVVIDWDQKVTELKSGNIDCVWNGMTLTDELKTNMDFSMPYAGNTQVCVVNKANADVYTTLESMADARIVAEAGSTGAATVEANETLKNAQLTTMTAQRDTLLELKSGTADVAVIDGVMAKASVGEGTSYDDLMIVEGLELSKEEYGVGLRKGSDLTAKINEALQQLADEGFVDQLAEKYPTVQVMLEPAA